MTHRVDAVRYFCASRFAPAESGGEDGTEDEEDKMSYFEFMTGRRPGKGETWAVTIKRGTSAPWPCAWS